MRRQQSCTRSRVSCIFHLYLVCLLTHVKISGPCKQDFVFITLGGLQQKNEKCDPSTEARTCKSLDKLIGHLKFIGLTD